MPAVHTNMANIAHEVANLVNRATPGRGSSSVARTGRTGIRVIGGGIIAAIVIGVVVFIVAIILAIFFYRRHKKQRARHQQEMQKYYGDNRYSIGTDAPAPGQAGYGNTIQGYGYSQGTGYGYAHTAQPGQAGYGAQNTGGVPPMAPAHTADHVTHTK
ncbi:hypothetical protein CI238_05232 [Colletotrichum incanum]|uniref:Uncharacterized protein n=1 Tax=Colletotrichum incanum TaxID=1573173 RepID=A0A167E0A0_COLIC|nr:hypothetical protein CI238_05232 [Colletotrichum incanum]OHX01169.1 hypothetical protein CSPAE12_00218 [Colletotrichum incanum]